MDLEHIQELMKAFEDSNISEIELEEEGKRIRLTKREPTVVAAPAPTAPVVTAPGAPAATPTPVPEEVDEGLVTIDSPMVGTFYSSPAPGEPPFVHEGDQVEEGQAVCIVEAMKLMNEVTAKFPGTIEKILVENAEPVEYGQPLFSIRLLEHA